MSHFLIIGYGNTLRGDDGAGQYVAQALMQESLEVEIITCHQLTPELVFPIAQADYVIYIDACLGLIPGNINVEHIEPEADAGAFTHDVTPMSLLAAAHNLYGHQPQAYLITIMGVDFDYGEVLSPQVESAVASVVNLIQSAIDNINVLDG
ncbi:MAG: hydrogenase maturation protease [Anaerolineaceae bacterium]|nr:hydrogenase maturation protease [Anaerolineaceae bacterium]